MNTGFTELTHAIRIAARSGRLRSAHKRTVCADLKALRTKLMVFTVLGSTLPSGHVPGGWRSGVTSRAHAAHGECEIRGGDGWDACVHTLYPNLRIALSLLDSPGSIRADVKVEILHALRQLDSHTKRIAEGFAEYASKKNTTLN